LKGASIMETARSEKSRPSVSIWSIGVRQIVFMALGAALYAGVSYATNTLQLPGASNVSLRPGIVIPVFFGAVFGPWVGLFSGGIGNMINDLLTGPIYWNWDLGNGLIGFVSGLAMLITWGRYRSVRAIVIAEIFGVLGIIVGLGFAAYTDIWVSALTPVAATTTEFVPATIPDLILSLILLPILLVAYNAAFRRSGRS
jgi:energy-coupling factor transport system substrate-specific component